MNTEKTVCPICGDTFQSQDSRAKQANNYNDCQRKCVKCGIGLSNAKNNPTIIYKDYKRNIPVQLVDGIEYQLQNALNIQNRKNKAEKIAFSTSEDAFTWSVFKYISKRHPLKLGELLNTKIDGNLSLLLWGKGIIGTKKEEEIEKELIAISNEFQENPERRTEPDVIIATDTQIIFIEMKLRSPNTIEKDLHKFDKYDNSAMNLDVAKRTKLYELYRNMSFLSKFKKFNNKILISVISEKHLKSEIQRDCIEDFKRGLDSEVSFFVLELKVLFDRLDAIVTDEWMKGYLKRIINTAT